MLQETISKGIIAKKAEDEEKLAEHTAKIKAKIESGSALDKSIIDREAIKELNHKEAHSKAKVVKAIEHYLIEKLQLPVFGKVEFSTIIVDATTSTIDILDKVLKFNNIKTHMYVLSSHSNVASILHLFARYSTIAILQYIHTFKYSNKTIIPKEGCKDHFEYIFYINIGNKPVNHLLPNVIESTYAKDSRNLGFYTNLLLRSANAGDTILGINITNGNLIKAAQAMLCSTVIIPTENAARLDCEKTIKELQFK